MLYSRIIFTQLMCILFYVVNPFKCTYLYYKQIYLQKKKMD